MRVHYVLNQGGTPESKLADVEIHFDYLQCFSVFRFPPFRRKRATS